MSVNLNFNGAAERRFSTFTEVYMSIFGRLIDTSGCAIMYFINIHVLNTRLSSSSSAFSSS